MAQMCIMLYKFCTNVPPNSFATDQAPRPQWHKNANNLSIQTHNSNKTETMTAGNRITSPSTLQDK
ncbi:hypothetical protein HanPSC8_Chr06g0243391 [Helianthus annuus]|nr:hypothetical protein HanPSC8_Chr06g0243391 [Helianthus annuus]